MISRWDPFAELYRLQDQLAGRAAEGERRSFTPAVDIFEAKDAIVVRAELPGLKAEDVSIDLHDRRLTLSGESRLEASSANGGYQRIERSYGSFARSFALPDTVDVDGVEAEMKDGLLTVRLPKRADTQPRKIAIKGGGEKAKLGSDPKRSQPSQPSS